MKQKQFASLSQKDGCYFEKDPITAEAIEGNRTSKWLGKEIYFYETIDSTNNEARRLAEQGKPHGTLVVAENQTSGRGRRGRSWVTPEQSAIAMSMLLRPQLSPASASMVTLVMGLAAAKACRTCCGVNAQIKWPNDVVAEGRKICGILTEMSSEIDRINYVVIGTGINTGVEVFPPELASTAVSLHELMDCRPVRAKLIAVCMEYFEQYYETFEASQNLAFLKEEYNGLLAGKGGRVRVLEPGKEYSGISEGINDYGELLVRREDGSCEAVYAGEVSVRGIYGYV